MSMPIGVGALFGLLGIAAVATLSWPACSGASCDDALAKMKACKDRLDCRDRDIDGRSKCRAAEARLTKALADLDGVPCVGPAEDIAEQVNNCPTVDPGPDSNCDPCTAR